MPSLPERAEIMLNRTKEASRKLPLTRLQKGKRYAAIVMLLGLAYSTYANVRSGQIDTEPVITSIAPTVVFFLTVHLISYFSPKSKFEKAMVWFGLGFVALVAFGISGFHIWELTVRNGQHWIIALFYPFIIDIPTALATAILVQKVSTNSNRTTQAKTDTTPQSAPNSTSVVKTPQKRTTATKSTKPATPRKRVPATTKPVIQETVNV